MSDAPTWAACYLRIPGCQTLHGRLDGVVADAGLVTEGQFGMDLPRAIAPAGGSLDLPDQVEQPSMSIALAKGTPPVASVGPGTRLAGDVV